MKWSAARTFNDPFDFKLELALANPELSKADCFLEFERVLDDPDIEISDTGDLKKLVSFFRAQTNLSLMDRAEARQWFDKYLDQLLPNLSEVVSSSSDELQEMISRYRFLCTSKETNSILMWSHYAANHSGAFLLFDPSPNEDWGERVEMLYKQRRPQLVDAEKLHLAAIGLVELDQVIRLSEVHEALRCKSAEWIYESEERFVFIDEMDRDFLFRPFKHDELIAIVFGCRTPKEEILSILKTFCDQFASTKWLQANDSQQSFGLSFSEIK